MTEIYTDGGCRRNGKPNSVGAWAYAVVANDKLVCAEADASWHVTNNIMEMTALLRALRYVAATPEVPARIYCDSQYVINGFTKWLPNWVKRDWMRWDGVALQMVPVKNAELWKEILELKDRLHVYFVWVRGHNGNRWNEHVDLLCNESMNIAEAQGCQIRVGLTGSAEPPGDIF